MAIDHGLYGMADKETHGFICTITFAC
jgi:hypothetical protein